MSEYINCKLCPRSCGVDRTGAARGRCRMGAQTVIGRAAPHFGEEPCLSGSNGVGAIFFTGCSLGCVYCQNQALTRDLVGLPVSPLRLRQIFDELIAQGVSGIDLINPTHFVPDILSALSEPLPVPVIYNCGGYEKPDTLAMLRGKIDIYLPDLKYVSPLLAERYSVAPDYFSYASSAIKEMYAQTGPYQLDEHGMMKSGVLIRHLVMPDALDNTFDVIDWLVESFSPGSVLFSLMGQYLPCGDLDSFPELQRPLREEEYKRAQDYLLALGWEDGYIQELDADTAEYVPKFDLTGVLPPSAV